MESYCIHGILRELVVCWNCTSLINFFRTLTSWRGKHNNKKMAAVLSKEGLLFWDFILALHYDIGGFRVASKVILDQKVLRNIPLYFLYPSQTLHVYTWHFLEHEREEKPCKFSEMWLKEVSKISCCLCSSERILPYFFPTKSCRPVQTFSQFISYSYYLLYYKENSHECCI